MQPLAVFHAHEKKCAHCRRLAADQVDNRHRKLLLTIPVITHRLPERLTHAKHTPHASHKNGKPGDDKTLTAQWLAAQLGLPLYGQYILDLKAIMSSLLGRSDNNLRAALALAKRSPWVLRLDEIDSIAKHRSDHTDVGELKRLVAVILQEVDEWPETGLLLAATNHPELIDPALWRRFDPVVQCS